MRPATRAAYRVDLRLRRRELRELRHRARGQGREHRRVASDGRISDRRPERGERDLLHRGAPSPRREIPTRRTLRGRVTRPGEQGGARVAKRIFLAGATSAVGRRMLPLLREAGYDVTGTTRIASRAEELRAAGITPVIVNVYDPAALRAAMLAARPHLL